VRPDLRGSDAREIHDVVTKINARSRSHAVAAAVSEGLIGAQAR
jgi:hypothetical protein